MHSEDAVVFALVLALASCARGAPSPASSLVGRGGERGGARRDAAVSEEDEQEEELDEAAFDAGLSERALPCRRDADCLTHRCDTALSRCRFPCSSDADCQAGASCAVEAGALAACFTR